MPNTNALRSKKASLALWVAQGLLAALFLFAGAMKLVMPIAALTKDAPLPGTFLRFIGVLEVLGALGLVLPGLLHLRASLTPLAAAGLVVIMSGAVGTTLATGQVESAGVPVIVGLLLALVALGRGTPLVVARVRGG
jgi:uncharacterized membrane protein YphA (DoxX/SURF4 family)